MDLSAKQQDILNKLLAEAVKSGDLPRVKTYVEKGADVHHMVPNVKERIEVPGGVVTARTSSAPLIHHMYATHFREDMADYLFSQGANVDATNAYGNTMLMLAVLSDRAERVKFLVAAGANPFHENQAGAVVLDEARRLPGIAFHRQEIIDVLMAAVPNQSIEVPAPDAQEGPGGTAKPIEAVKPVTFKPKPGSHKPGFNL